jgi:predicted nucleic acid-binding protein
MALVLWLERQRLPQEVKAVFENAENDNAGIFIPAIVLAEIGYLSERSRIETNLTKEMIRS